MNAGMDAPGPSTALPSTGRGVTLTVVVPCFNERANVPILIAKLTEVLAGLTWEVIFVDDDSPD